MASSRHWIYLVRLMIKVLSIVLRTLNYGNYGIFLIMGNAGFIINRIIASGV